MAFFKTNTNQAALVESTGGGSFIGSSGIYDIVIKIASVDVNDKNARAINFNVEYNNNDSTLYGLKLDNNDGTPNYQADIFNKLCIIADIAAVTDPEIQTHSLGKDKKPTDLSVLTDFTDLACKVRVQEEYSKWNGNIKKRLNIKAFYREDGANAAEIASGDNIGSQLTKDTEYATNVTYKDGLTDQDIKTWQAAKKSGGAAPAATTAPKGNLFA